MSIGTRIKETRLASKMTQKELCAKVGIKQGTLSELETGESAGTTLIASFAAALNVNPLWLETGKGERAILKIEAIQPEQPTIGKKEIETYPADIQEVIDLMLRTDDRGRLKMKIAATDAYELHNSHISRTRPTSLNADEIQLVESIRNATPMAKKVIKAAITGAEKTNVRTSNKKTG